MHIYFIPGTANDERLFGKIKLNGYETTCLPWLRHIKNENLQDYAKRLKVLINENEPFAIIGMSLGGIVATELAKITKPHKTVLISTIKTRREMPFYYKILNWLPLYKIINKWFIDKFMWMIYPFHGVMSRSEYRLYKQMILESDIDFVKWAWGAVLKWRNTEIPRNMLHLHGTNDYVFPVINIKGAVKIKGGSHYMVMRKPIIISKLILNFIES